MKPGTKSRAKVVRWVDRSIFISLLSLIGLVAIPYGTVEPWWIALYESAVFSLGAVAIPLCIVMDRIGAIRGFSEKQMFAPIVALLFFVCLQSVSLPLSVESLQLLNIKGTVSSDPFETRLLFLKLLALALNACLLILFTSNRRRLRVLIHVVLGVAVASALFGILRQALQHSEMGFFLSYLRRNSGFGQFINKNHFAFLMEMGAGLGTGFIVGGAVRRERLLLYIAALVLMWVALVLTASRGALFSMLVQILFLIGATVWLRSRRRDNSETRDRRPPAQRPLALIFGRAVLGFSLAAAVVVSAVWVGGDLLVTRMESLSAELKIEATEPHAGVKRREVWGATWQLIKSHPLVGSGFGAYGVAITRFHDASGNWVPEAAHNDYLELLSSGGIVGLVLVGWFVVIFIKRARNQLLSVEPFPRAASLAALTGIIGVMAHNVVDFGLHVTANAVVFVALVVIATKELPAEMPHKFFKESYGILER